MPQKPPNPMFYVPERVFFYNLFRCCQCKPSDLAIEVNENMKKDIGEYQFAISHQINNVAKKDLPTVENQYILPGPFIKYVEGKCHQSAQKAGNYVLAKCHRKICEAKRSIEQDNKARKYKPINTAKDREILKIFENLVSKSEALSDRQFHRILQPFSEASDKSCSEGKTYGTLPDYIVRFTISKVFPQIYTPREKSFFDILTSHDWQNIVYKVPAKKGEWIRVISIDDINRDDFEMCMQQHFDRLKKLVSNLNSKNPSDIDEVGDELLAMYDDICNYNEAGKIFGIKCTHTTRANSSKLNFSEQVCKVSIDDAKYKYEAEMSSHICNFMKWIHLEPTDSHKFMEFVDKIIEKIRDQVLGRIGLSFSLEEFCSCRKADCSSNSLFLWSGNADLLHQLLDAMHNESLICLTIAEMEEGHE